MNYLDLEKKIKKSGVEYNLPLIKDAYNFAADAHKDQKRLSGESYIVHPLSVAIILVELGSDTESVIAALLHDVIEDTEYTKDDISLKFGDVVAELVDGVTTLGTIDFSKLPSEEVQEAKFKSMIESLRKFFLAMAKDIRVVVIKLADRLHNMRTLGALSRPNQKRIARETLEIFAPLADRLGMGSLKAELEDLAFKYSQPIEYQRLVELLETGDKERWHYLSKIKRHLKSELDKAGVNAEIDGRAKHLYSIYKKLVKSNGNIAEIYDILAVRIIVDNVEDCYRVLGIIHKDFKPLIYRIKDYIAVPKPNGYQSLHTTVFGIDGRITEIQIRTKEMHEEAEYGVAAHWHYAETKAQNAYQGKASFAKENKTKWVREIMELGESGLNSDELAENLSIDLFNNRIFVTTPKGDVFDLPEGATPVDFAYEIHTEIGHRCRGAKVNGQIVQLDYELSNRDVVEIILASKNDKSGPSRGWLDFVKTAKAKQNIKSWFRRLNRDDSIIEGHKLLSEELSLFNIKEEDLSSENTSEVIGSSGWKSWNDVVAAVGEGTVSARQVVKKVIGQKYYKDLEEKLAAEKRKDVIEDDNSGESLEGILVRYAECCHPTKGDKIKGYITKGYGITIHKADCRNLLTSSKEKIIEINFDLKSSMDLTIEIISIDRLGLIKDITTVISQMGVDIRKFDNDHDKDGNSICKIKIRVDNPSKFADLLPKLKKVKGVINVRQV